MPDLTPVLVGSAQYVDREPPSAASLSPAAMAAQVASAAIEDTGAPALRESIDVLAVARLFEHSVKDTVMWPNPYGCSDNMPWSVANRVGLKPSRAIYAEVGGETPQRLVNQLCGQINDGQVRAALLTGAEALATIRQGQRVGLELDWQESVAGEYEDLWPDAVMASAYEQAHGITFPIQVYALFEQARRHRLGLSNDSYRQAIGQLFAPFSEIAADNPYAQFPRAMSINDIAEISPKNFALCEPYAKWMVAQDAVNQAASVVLTSVAEAERLGIPEANWIYLLAGADSDEQLVVERPRLDQSPAQAATLQAALNTAEVDIDAISHIDFYSCFPIAVFTASETLGLPFDGSRQLTLTGGLPYFGGPGNNYSLHAIAEVVQQLRGRDDAKALVAANGGYLSKHSVGIYAATAKTKFASEKLKNDLLQPPQTPVCEVAAGAAMIESYAASYHRGEAVGGTVIGRMHNNNSRVLAVVDQSNPPLIDLLFGEDAIGHNVQLEHRDGINRVVALTQGD